MKQVSYLLMLLIYAIPALAEQSGHYFTIGGLSFACDRCRAHGRISCEIPLEGEQRIIPCEKARLILLKRVLATNPPSPLPTPNELVQFLLAEQQTDQVASQALMILSSRDSHSDILSGNLHALVHHYPKAFTETLSDLQVHSSLAGELWHIVKMDLAGKSDLVVGLIALDNSRVLDTIQRLPVKHAKRALHAVQALASAFERANLEMPQDLKIVGEELAECITSANQGLPSVCSTDRWHSYNQHLLYYLRKVRHYATLSLLAEETEPQAVLERLSTLDSEQFRTPGSLALLGKVVRLIEDRQAYALLDEYGDVLLSSAPYSDLLASEASVLYAQKASNELDTNIERSLLSLSTSYRLDRGPSQGIRADLERKLSTYPTTATLKQKISSVIDEHIQETYYVPFFPLIFGSVVICLIGFLLLLIQTRRTKRVTTLSHDLTGSPVVRVGNYFQITKDSTEQELKRQFRKLAKELHPDATSASIDGFAQLKTDYEAALDRLRKLRAVG